MMFGTMKLFSLLLFVAATLVAQPGLRVDTPMTPPDWALMERALLDANSDAVEAFADRYIDERGYLAHTPRWGTLDGPDDAIETSTTGRYSTRWAGPRVCLRPTRGALRDISRSTTNCVPS